MLFPDEAAALAPHNHSAPASALPKLQRSTPATPKRLLANNNNNNNTLNHHINASSSSQQMNFPQGSGVSFIPGYFVIQDNNNQKVQPQQVLAPSSTSSITKENAAPIIPTSTTLSSSSSPKIVENKIPTRQQPGQVVDAQDFFPEFLNLPLNPPYWRKSAHKFLEANGMLSHSVNEEGGASSKSPINSPLSQTASSIRRRRTRGSNQENNNNNNLISSIPEIDVCDDEDYYDDDDDQQEEGPNWRNLFLNSISSPKQKQRSPKLATIADVIQDRINRGGSEVASTRNTPTRYTVDDYYFSSPTPEKNINKSKNKTANQRQDLNITPKRTTPTTGINNNNNYNNQRNSKQFDHRYDLENERVWAASDQLVAELLQREKEERLTKRDTSEITNNKSEKRVSIRDNNSNQQPLSSLTSYSAPPTPTASNNVDRFKKTQAVIVVPPSMFFDPKNKNISNTSSSSSSSAIDYTALMASVARSTPASFNPYLADTSARLFKPRTDDVEEKKKAADLGLRRTPGRAKPVVAAKNDEQQPVSKQVPTPTIIVTRSPVSAFVKPTDDDDNEEENKKKANLSEKKEDAKEKIEVKPSHQPNPPPVPTKSTSETSTSPMKFQQEKQQDKEKEKQKSNPPSPSHSVVAPTNASVQCQTIEDRGTQTVDNTLVDRGLPPPNHQRQNPEGGQLSRIGVYQLDSPPRIHQLQQQGRRNQNSATNKNGRQPSLGNDSAISEITPNGGNQNFNSVMGGRNRLSVNNNNNRNNSGASAFSSNYSSASVSGSTAASGKRRGIAINARLLARPKLSESNHDEVDEIAEREAELRIRQGKNMNNNSRIGSSPRLRYSFSPEKRLLALSRNGNNNNNNNSIPSPTLNKSRNSPEVSQDPTSSSLLNSLSTSILVNPIAINRIRRDNITQKLSRTPSRERNQNVNDAVNNTTNTGTPLRMNNNNSNSSLPSSPIPPLAPTTPRSNNNNIYNVNPILLPTPPRQQQQQPSPVSSRHAPRNVLTSVGSPTPSLLNEPKQQTLSPSATTITNDAASPQRTPKVTIVVDGDDKKREQQTEKQQAPATVVLPSTNVVSTNHNIASSPENNNNSNSIDEVKNSPVIQDASFSAASPSRKNTEAFDETTKPNSDEPDPASLHNISMTVSNSNNLFLSSQNSEKEDISENEKQETKKEINNSNQPEQQQVMDPEDLRETVETFEKAIELYRAELAKEQKRRKMAEQQLASVLKRGGATNVVGNNNNNSNARTNSVGRSSANSMAGTPSSRSGSQVPMNNNNNNIPSNSSAVRLQRLPSIHKNPEVKNGNDNDDDDHHDGDVMRKKASTNLTGGDDSSLLTSRTLRPTVNTNNNNPNSLPENHEPLSPAPPGLPMFKTPFASGATAVAGSTNKNNTVSATRKV